MKILIVGAGEVGHHAAKMLANENQDIVIMDSDEERLRDLSTSYDLLTKVGSPTSINDLKEAGVNGVDLFAVILQIHGILSFILNIPNLLRTRASLV